MIKDFFAYTLPLATFGLLIYQLSKTKKIMDAQTRLEQANEKTAAALAGVAADIRTLVDQIKNGTVTEEAIAKAEANAAALEALDAENPTSDEGAGDGE